MTSHGSTDGLMLDPKGVIYCRKSTHTHWTI